MPSPAPLTPPIAYDAASPAAREVFDHIRRITGREHVAVEFQMLARTPTAMRDAFENQYKHLTTGAGFLDAQQREAICLAVSSANNCHKCVKAHRRKAIKLGWSEDQAAEILAVTAVCTMLNTYHRYRHIADDADLPADSGLSFDAITHPTLPPMLVELICLAVSSVMGCELCTKHHRAQALRHGATADQVHEAIRVASVMTLFNVYFRAQ